MPNSLTDAYTTIQQFTSTEKRRFDPLANRFLVIKAEIYGNRIAPIMDDPLIQDLAKDPRVFQYLVTGDTTEVDPEDNDRMHALTREIVEANEFAMRSIEFSTEGRRRELAKEYLNSLKPTERLAFNRDGTLEDRTQAYVVNKLDERYV